MALFFDIVCEDISLHVDLGLDSCRFQGAGGIFQMERISDDERVVAQPGDRVSDGHVMVGFSDVLFNPSGHWPAFITRAPSVFESCEQASASSTGGVQLAVVGIEDGDPIDRWPGGDVIGGVKVSGRCIFPSDNDKQGAVFVGENDVVDLVEFVFADQRGQAVYVVWFGWGGLRPAF